MAQCNYTKDGKPCRSRIGIDKSGRCFTHSELRHRVKAREEGRRRGGHSTNQRRTVMPHETPPPPETLVDVAAWLKWIAVSVTTGRIDARTAREATAALRELRPTLEKIEIGERMKEMEEQLRTAKAAGSAP